MLPPYNKEKNEIIEACLWLSDQGFFGSQRGSGGNISLRLVNKAMAITPTSVRYQALSSEDICVVGFDNTIIEAKTGRKPSIESAMHGVIYQNRPDVNAVVHTHQIYGSVFAVLNLPIPALFDEVSLALGPVIEIIPYALSGSPELANHVGSILSNKANAYIMQNHGILALGTNLNQAILHAELLEKLAHIYCLALSTGQPVCTLPSATLGLVTAARNASLADPPK